MQMQQVKKQQGFTIIELVVVILLLGILAATALPRFIDVTSEAHESAFAGTAGGFATGVALYRAEWVGRGQGNNAPPSFAGLRPARGFDLGAYTEYVDGVSASNYVQSTFTGPRNGYPFSGSASRTYANFEVQDCVDVFQGVLQGGAATVAIADLTTDGVFSDFDTPAGATGSIRADVIEAQGAGSADFQVFMDVVEIDTGFSELDINGDAATTPSGEPLNHTQNAKACVYIYSADPESLVTDADAVLRSILYIPWTGRVETFNTAEELSEGTYTGPRVS